MEAAEVDEMGEVAFEAGIGWGEGERGGENEAASGFEETCSRIEEVSDELAEIRDGNAFAHWRIGDDKRNRAGIEFSKVAGDELCCDVLEVGGCEVLTGDFEGFGAESCADDFRNPAEKRAFDEFEAEAAEGVPNDFVFEWAGESGHAGRERWMRRRRNVATAVSEARIGRDFWGEDDASAFGCSLDFDGPRCVAAAVDEVRIK